MLRKRHNSLKPNQVKYLAFEGGGGKGAAYLGALWALDNNNIGRLNWIPHPVTKRRVLDNKLIKGISGASAGAITALLLSCGYTINEIEGFVKGVGKKGSFYDEPTPLMIPEVNLKRKLARIDSCIKKTNFSQSLWAALIAALADLYPFSELREKLEEKANGKEPLAMITSEQNFSLYLFNLFEDNGLMSGCMARGTLDTLVAYKTRDLKTGDRIHSTTFKQHYDYHKIKLTVSGTNLETGRTQYFSVDETPDFRVADAVRISMSFPFVYKPVVISEGKYKGVWIDGGVLDNIPIHAFDPKPDGIINDHILAIRLELTQERKITDFISYLKAFFGTAFGAGETLQIRTQKEVDQMLIIDTGKLDTLDFDPDVKILKEAISNGAKAVLKYFTGKEGPIKPYTRFPAEKP